MNEACRVNNFYNNENNASGIGNISYSEFCNTLNNHNGELLNANYENDDCVFRSDNELEMDTNQGEIEGIDILDSVERAGEDRRDVVLNDEMVGVVGGGHSFMSADSYYHQVEKSMHENNLWTS